MFNDKLEIMENDNQPPSPGSSTSSLSFVLAEDIADIADAINELEISEGGDKGSIGVEDTVGEDSLAVMTRSQYAQVNF